MNIYNLILKYRLIENCLYSYQFFFCSWAHWAAASQYLWFLLASLFSASSHALLAASMLVPSVLCQRSDTFQGYFCVRHKRTPMMPEKDSENLLARPRNRSEWKWWKIYLKTAVEYVCISGKKLSRERESWTVEGLQASRFDP